MWPAWGLSEAKHARIAAPVRPFTEPSDHLKAEARERNWETE
jgi:hypothetical protein